MQRMIAAGLAAAGVLGFAVLVHAQAPGRRTDGSGPEPAPQSDYRVPRTPWGDPDLQGTWPSTHMGSVPLQRAESLGTRNVLTDAEFAQRQMQAARQADQDLEDFNFDKPSVPFGQVGGGQSPPQHWFERGEPQRQASLIVEPASGRLPAPAAAQKRSADSHSPIGLDADFTLYERCITRGLVGSILPGGYNNGNQIVQSPGYVTILNEMIHEARIVPLDGRAHLNPAIRSYLGDSRGRWDGDTLVVETTNFIDRRGVGVNNTGASQALTITERFRRTNDSTLSYSMTVDDREMWSAPFTLQYTLKRDEGYGMFEYACHEGNYALQNILSGARVK